MIKNEKNDNKCEKKIKIFFSWKVLKNFKDLNNFSDKTWGFSNQ